jgi:hypothetical protein
MFHLEPLMLKQFQMKGKQNKEHNITDAQI